MYQHCFYQINIKIILFFTDEETSPGPEKTGCPVRVPRADDETFQAFFAPVLQQEKPAADVDVDLDAIDSGSRHL